ncbi:MAG: endonuclease III [Spirochaetota bacterium]
MTLQDKAVRIYTIFESEYGIVRPALVFQNTYQLAVAVILSAQTTDRQVNIVTPELFRRYPDFKSLSAADAADVEEIIRSTGFYRTKTKNIIALACRLMHEFGGILPDTIDGLVSLPGIGRKSANVIISQGFGRPGLAVDTHVSRVSNRLGLSGNKHPDKIEHDLKFLLPEESWSQAHLLFIHHGRTTCFARTPECHRCPVRFLCTFPGSNP